MSRTTTLRKGSLELEAHKEGLRILRPSFGEAPNPVCEGYHGEDSEREALRRARELETMGYKVSVKRVLGITQLPGFGGCLTSELVYSSKDYYSIRWNQRTKVYERLTPNNSSGITNRKNNTVGLNASQSAGNQIGSTVQRNTVMTETTTQPVEEKLSIAQKVEALQSEKTRLAGELNEAPENAKANIQERIAVIDRKLRWYAGRSAEGKGKAKAERPTKAAKKAKEQTAAPATEPAPATAANES